MSTYVCSDIHGQYGLYKSMLEQIEFSKEDHLYILGDMIDRGPDGLQILRDASARANVTCLLGNHEHMMWNYLNRAVFPQGEIWLHPSNGGKQTLNALRKLPEHEKESVKKFLADLYLQVEITVEGVTFLLSHSCFLPDYGTVKWRDSSIKNKIRIFGASFVKNNKDNCHLLIDDQVNELHEHLKLNKNQINKEKLEIKLIETKIITNFYNMFNNCSELISLPDISEWDTTNVTNISNMFYKCSSLLSLPDISKWNTENVTKMSFMFDNCSSLKSLPDISKWNTKNVTDMSGMFYHCNSFISLPDISKWDTSKVINMANMFYNCTSLTSLPDISVWNTKNLSFTNSMFYNCKALTSFPDISKWNTSKLTQKDSMFAGVDKYIIPQMFK